MQLSDARCTVTINENEKNVMTPDLKDSAHSLVVSNVSSVLVSMIAIVRISL